MKVQLAALQYMVEHNRHAIREEADRHTHGAGHLEPDPEQVFYAPKLNWNSEEHINRKMQEVQSMMKLYMQSAAPRPRKARKSSTRLSNPPRLRGPPAATNKASRSPCRARDVPHTAPQPLRPDLDSDASSDSDYIYGNNRAGHERSAWYQQMQENANFQRHQLRQQGYQPLHAGAEAPMFTGQHAAADRGALRSAPAANKRAHLPYRHRATPPSAQFGRSLARIASAPAPPFRRGRYGMSGGLHPE